MPTLQEAMRDFLRVDRSRYTNRDYAYRLDKLVAAIGPERDVSHVTPDDLFDYLDALRRSSPDLKPSSLAVYVGTWHTFFNWCIQEEYLVRSPVRRIRVRVPDPEPVDRAIPTSVLNAMLEAVRYHVRNYAILLFLIDTGCRVGGAQSLTLPRLNLDAGQARLFEKGGHWHTAYFGEVTAAAIEAWLKERHPAKHDYVWTTTGKAASAIGAEAISDVVRWAAARIGSPKLWGGHSIRHAVGHAYAEADVPLWITGKKLGHRSNVTQRYYPSGEKQLKEITKAMPLAPLRQATDTGSKIIRFRDWSA